MQATLISQAPATLSQAINREMTPEEAAHQYQLLIQGGGPSFDDQPGPSDNHDPGDP
jgi:hypothetical protein